MIAEAECCNVQEEKRDCTDSWRVPDVPQPRDWHSRDSRASCRRRALSVSDVVDAVTSSRWVLSLTPDWDGEGSKAYDKAVWERATGFVLAHAETLWETYGFRMDVPRILPGPHGSIDVHWKTRRYELLINFPAISGELATFYGDDYGRMVIKGTLEPKATNLGLLLWLTQLG